MDKETVETAQQQALTRALNRQGNAIETQNTLLFYLGVVVTAALFLGGYVVVRLDAINFVTSVMLP